MDPILDPIDAALKRKDLSDAAASKLAVGHPSLLKNMRLPVDGDKRYNLPALMKLAEVLDLEFYFGPRRDTGIVETLPADSPDYAHIPVHAASLAAGNGLNNDSVEIIDHLAFRRSWLDRIGVMASMAVLARVQGDSMAPSIKADDMVLIDRSKAEVPVRQRAPKDTRPAPIYAILVDGMARVKRIERPEPDIFMLVSDNPTFGAELLTGAQARGLNVIGKVMWWGHTNKE